MKIGSMTASYAGKSRHAVGNGFVRLLACRNAATERGVHLG